LVINTTEYAKAYKKAYDANFTTDLRIGKNYSEPGYYSKGKLDFGVNTINDNGSYYSGGKYIASS
jgi:hypothetical protein